MDYESLTQALLKRYDLTEFGYRRFCDAKPEGQQSPGQFIVRQKNYFTKWVNLAYPEDEKSDSYCKTEKTINANCLETIQTTSRPTTKKKVRSFFRLLNCYQVEIPSFAAISAPLRDLTFKELPNKIKQGKAQERAFWTLQECLPKNCGLKWSTTSVE